MKSFRLILTCFTFGVFVISCSTESRISALYKKYKVVGSFALYNYNEKSYFNFNPDDFSVATTPASTFKICNSLIGIETGVITTEDFIIPWDSVNRSVPVWNTDTDLKSAFKNSTVWYYQELARRVGGEKMKYWLNKCNYGNTDTSGRIDWFWLTGGLRITPKQQIQFLKQLYLNELPFSRRTMDIVKNIMLVEKNGKYTLSAKTGWGFDKNTDIGWYVGYVETKNNVFFFSNRVYCTDEANPLFLKARTEIAKKALKILHVLP